MKNLIIIFVFVVSGSIFFSIGFAIAPRVADTLDDCKLGSLQESYLFNECVEILREIIKDYRIN